MARKILSCNCFHTVLVSIYCWWACILY